ncbi:hypothetical protein ACFO1B_49935 [Dactylosporangium siamense]|uniref:hypothetical protein n=1 Tax=Dactylosporangium siamense TaxID=685454 RepID=UPI00360830D1
MRFTSLFAGLCAAALLSGCGGSGTPSSQATATSSGAGAGGAAPPVGVGADPAAVFLQVAECFRAHGHPDYPDPVQNSDGSWGFPVTGRGVPVPAECADVVRRSAELSTAGSAGPSPAADLSAFARCMRANGVPDWPDPNADGTFTVPDRLADPRDERLWRPAADGACRPLQPAGGPDIVTVGGR